MDRSGFDSSDSQSSRPVRTDRDTYRPRRELHSKTSTLALPAAKPSPRVHTMTPLTNCKKRRKPSLESLLFVSPSSTLTQRHSCGMAQRGVRWKSNTKCCSFLRCSVLLARIPRTSPLLCSANAVADAVRHGLAKDENCDSEDEHALSSLEHVLDG